MNSRNTITDSVFGELEITSAVWTRDLQLDF